MAEEKNFSFPKLNAEDVEIRIAQVNKGGAEVLVYKDARCDQKALDKEIGPMNWQKTYREVNGQLVCDISIWDENKKTWVHKEDCGTESNVEKEKGQFSDAQKRAAFAWGVGRELYTAPKMFFFSQELSLHTQNEHGKWVCGNTFRCENITYDKDKISTITVGIYEYSKKIGTKTFSNAKATTTSSTQTGSPAKNTAITPSQTQAKPQASAQTQQPSASTQNNVEVLIRDDEKILMGNFRGQLYGDVKSQPKFKEFLKWAKDSDPKYQNEEIAKQFGKFKLLAQKVC